MSKNRLFAFLFFLLYVYILYKISMKKILVVLLELCLFICSLFSILSALPSFYWQRTTLLLVNWNFKLEVISSFTRFKIYIWNIICLASDVVPLLFSTFVFPAFPLVKQSTDLFGHLETWFALPLFYSVHLNISVTIIYYFILLSTGNPCSHFFPKFPRCMHLVKDSLDTLYILFN